LRSSVVTRIADIAARDWDALHDGCNPFLSHSFLAGLEQTGCVGAHNGWQAQIVTLYDERGLLAAAPAWLKHHSFGEFVFDFSWAQAYARSGLAYYPKLVIGVPFTPVTGPRLLVRSDADGPSIRARLLAAILARAGELQLSSVHLLFVEAQDLAAAVDAGFLARQDCQFHWRNQGYANFDAYLAAYTAENRKKTRQERRYVAEAGVQFETRHGNELTDAEIVRVHALIERTFNQRGNEPYVSAAFLRRVARELGRRMVVQLAKLENEIVGTAVFFRGADSLYGRYWGSDRFIKCLHFEACYYRGIDYCITERIGHFDPGVQGEHKIKRGFGAHLTRSAHWIADVRYRYRGHCAVSNARNERRR
jgi:uncharacterized protein